MTEYSSYIFILHLISALVSHTFDNSEFSSHLTEECTVNGAMTELYIREFYSSTTYAIFSSRAFIAAQLRDQVTQL